MTALPTTVGETNTQPWVSMRHSASHGFAELAPGARSSACIGARCRSNKAATTMNDRLRIRPPDECSYCPPQFGPRGREAERRESGPSPPHHFFAGLLIFTESAVLPSIIIFTTTRDPTTSSLFF